jgi:hypothetical protein
MNANRRFLHEAIRRGLELEVITPADVLAHVTPDVLAHLPIPLKARLLQTSLSADRMTPQLVIETIGVEALAEHAPTAALWACVRACAARQLQEPTSQTVATSVATSVAAATRNGGGAANAGDDPQFKAPAPPRSTSLRAGSTPPPRISSLSPRSQLLRRASEPSPAPVASGMFEIAPSDSVPDFEIVEATEVPNRHRALGRSDDDSGSKL